MKLPHIVRKFVKLAQVIGAVDVRTDISESELRKAIPSRYRITGRDVEITLRELERNRQLERLDRKRVRFR